MSNDNDFKNYRQLLSRVDEKFSGVMTRYPSSFQCRMGCFGCCKSGLTVTHVEARHIANWLVLNSAGAVAVTDETVTSGKDENSEDEYCAFLNQDGACSIYEVRPIVCRSHGSPILVPSVEEPGALDADVCPLNFQEIGLEAITSEDWIRLDTLNVILSVIDREFDPENAGLRCDLTPAGILKGKIQ